MAKGSALRTQISFFRNYSRNYVPFCLNSRGDVENIFPGKYFLNKRLINFFAI